MLQTLICHDIKFSVSQMEKLLVSVSGLRESQTTLHSYTGTEKRCVTAISNRRRLAAYMRCRRKNTSVSADASMTEARPCYLCVVRTVHGIVRCLPPERFPVSMSQLWLRDFKLKAKKQPPEVTVM